MFGTTAFDRMPDSFLRDPAVWDGFVGKVWQAVMTPLDLRSDGCVIEVAPGSSAKIGHALAALRFSGAMHVVEPSIPARKKIAEQYRLLLPTARLHFYDTTLMQALPHLPRHADALVGNHIIDDMLLGASTQADDTFDWAAQYSDDIAPQTRTAFAHLQQKQTVAIAEVSNDIAHSIAMLAPRHVILSQYPSSTLQDNGLGALNDSAVTVLEHLRAGLPATHSMNDCAAALNSLPHYNNAHIGLNVLNPRYWLSCTKKI